jgi:hypothetical protein
MLHPQAAGAYLSGSAVHRHSGKDWQPTNQDRSCSFWRMTVALPHRGHMACEDGGIGWGGATGGTSPSLAQAVQSRVPGTAAMRGSGMTERHASHLTTLSRS